MIVGCTGHRVIGGYELPNPQYMRVCKETEKQLLVSVCRLINE